MESLTSMSSNDGYICYIAISTWSALFSRGETAKHKHASLVVVVLSDPTASQLAITHRQIRIHGLLN